MKRNTNTVLVASTLIDAVNAAIVSVSDNPRCKEVASITADCGAADLATVKVAFTDSTAVTLRTVLDYTEDGVFSVGPTIVSDSDDNKESFKDMDDLPDKIARFFLTPETKKKDARLDELDEETIRELALQTLDLFDAIQAKWDGPRCKTSVADFRNDVSYSVGDLKDRISRYIWRLYI